MVLGVWLHCVMGLRSSPYNVIQGALVAKRFVLGDPNDSTNAFQRSSISEKLPFSTTYNASEPKLRKWRVDGMTASKISQYVDNLRLITATKELAWQARIQVAKGLCWLGLQDAACKRRMGSQRPRAWTGSIITSDGTSMRKLVTKERWSKTQRNVCWLARHVGLGDARSTLERDVCASSDGNPPPGSIHFKTMEKFVRFLVYVAGT